MRCLNCRAEVLSTATDVCPGCGVHLPSLLRDVLPPGTVLRGGSYELEFALGRGGFGITYQGRHRELDHPVAVKEFYPQDHAQREATTGRLVAAPAREPDYQQALERFVREGRILARLRHPNVVRVHDLFQEQGTAYLVMELVSGHTLQEELRSHPARRLPPERVQTVVGELVAALESVHGVGIYHLDLKPDNVLVEDTGRVVLVDFGAARHGFGSDRMQSFTLEYAAPEVLTGDPVGPESDVFELGMLLYELLTGERPPPALARLRGDSWEPVHLGTPWQSLVLRALRLARAERPASVRAWWGAAAGREPADPAPPRPAVTPGGAARPMPAALLAEAARERGDSAPAAGRRPDRREGAAPAAVSALLREARSAVTADQIENAVALLRHAVGVQPDDVRLHAELARLYARRGSADEACAEWELVAALDDRYPELYDQLARCYNQLNRFADAAALLERALRDPAHRHDAGLYQALAVAYFNLSRRDEALWALDRALGIRFDPRLAALRRSWQSDIRS